MHPYIFFVSVFISQEIGAHVLDQDGQSIALIKSKESSLEAGKSIASQVQVITLNGGQAGVAKADDSRNSALYNMQQVTKHMLNPLAKLLRSAQENQQVWLDILDKLSLPIANSTLYGVVINDRVRKLSQTTKAIMQLYFKRESEIWSRCLKISNEVLPFLAYILQYLRH